MMFYKETSFEETRIGRIPKDWAVAQLGDNLIEIETGKRAKGGALSEGDVASIGGEHIDTQGNILWGDMKFIPEDFYEFLKQGKVNLGDILLVKDGATTGKVAMVRKLEYEKVAVNEHVFIVRSKADRLIDEFLFHFLFSKYGQIQIETRFHGLIGGIIRDDLETVLIPLPPILEQQKITEVLSGVDLAIANTDEVIAKTERLKKGLMQQLLTRGIGHKEYKDTPIGKTPKTWQIMKLEDLSEDGIKNGVFKRRHEFGKGAPLVNVLDLFDGLEVNFRKLARVSVNERELHQFKVMAGDILFCRSSLNVEGVGHACLVGAPPEPSVFECHVMRARPRKNIVLPEYLVVYCLSPYARRFILTHSKTTTMTTINQSDLGRLPVALPPLNEQTRIAEIVYTIEKKLKLERKQKARLKRVKRGLMDLLLSGKVRVKGA